MAIPLHDEVLIYSIVFKALESAFREIEELFPTESREEIEEILRGYGESVALDWRERSRNE